MAWQYQVLGLLFMSLSFNVTFSMPPNSSSLLSTTPHLCHPNQSSALLQFKNSFAIDSSVSYPKTKNWTEGVDCCSWDGVTCDMLSGNVIGLDLSWSGIQGSFNSNNTLFLLPHLQRLNLAFNNFNYSLISPKFGQFTSLTYLNLSFAYFSGIVPTEISHLSKLVSLDLSGDYNNLQFERQGFQELLQNLTELRELLLDYTSMSSVNLNSLSNLSSSLLTLSLKDCSLHGKLPENVFHLPDLQILNLEGNDLLNVTLSTFNWVYSLKSLDLSGTGLTGYLPQSIGDLKSLETLDLSYTRITGYLPQSIGELKSLNTLDLTACNFLGSIPASVGNLTKLTSLSLDSNHFTGQIPTSLSNLKSLQELGIAWNNLYGIIPEIFHNLIQIDFSNNQLSGQIPLSIFNLNQLTSLSLDANQLSGLIPDHVSRFSSLIELHLSNNQFSGTLNFKLFSKLRNLNSLDLSFNNISLEFDNQENTTWPLFESLGLSSCNLTSFPTFLGTQNQLDTLDLSCNRIQGDIPNWLWLNTSLMDLNISHNLLTSVEAHPEKIKTLQYLDLRSNLIQAPLSPLISLFQTGFATDSDMGYYLDDDIDSYMFLSSNKFTGEIPTSICNINSLAIVDFSNNSLSGAIPKCLGSLNQLLVLNLRMNNFNGTIPRNFSGNTRLRSLNLNDNQLEGSLPKSLANCKNLEIVDIGNNNIQGEFPNWLESLPKLQVLILRANRFYGSISKPNSATPFQMLRIMDISNNTFTGFLPEEYFKNMKALMTTKGKGKGVTYMGDLFYQSYYHDSVIVTIKGLDTEYERVLTIFATIDLSMNNFGGHIPEIIGNFISLEGLNFSHNNLSGQIPLSLANMSTLESLDLSSNALVGVIPQQLTNLKSLEVLNVSCNELEGPIPEGFQFNTFKNDSYMGNSGLCGFPLSRKCGDSETKPSTTTVEDEEDYIDWKIVMMGYTTGLVIGLSMAYIVFTIRKPLWFVEMVERKLNERGRRRN